MNWLAIAVAAAANVIVGSIYYAPPVMGNTWLKLLGKRREQLGQAGPSYGLVIVSAVITSAVLAYFINQANLHTLGGGLLAGLLAWVGFIATSTAVGYVFEKRPFALFAVNTGAQLITLVVMGAILGAWK
jgi:hypothetical protein